MCRHIAATLTGIGARLDEDPMLFFTLRGVDAGDLISHAVGVISSTAEDLLQKDPKKSSRKIEGADLSAAYGVARAENAGSSSSDDAAAAKKPDDESARMADVRKILKKQLKMDAKLAKKEKLSIIPLAPQSSALFDLNLTVTKNGALLMLGTKTNIPSEWGS